MSASLSKIIDLINSESYQKAEIELKKIYPQNPDSYDLNKLLGVTLLAQRNYRPALKCFEKCIKLREDDYDVILNLSYIFTKIQFYEQGIEYSEKAIAINPQRPQAYQNLATCYFYLNQYEKAEEITMKSINSRGGIESQNFLTTGDLIILYANILLAQDKNNDLKDFANHVLSKTYIQSLLIRLLRLDPANIQPRHLEMTEEIIKKSENIKNKVERNTALSDAYFFIGEYYAKKNQSLSEESYIKANQLIAEMQRESLFKRQKYALGIYNFFRDSRFEPIMQNIDEDKGKGLIFVLGMPRSGTTLTESILSTASNLKAGGEKSFFSLQLHSTLEKIVDFQETVELDEVFFQDLGDRYIDHIRLHRENNYYFVDKLPENYLFYKFIKIALPAAKFIHCHRDPWDNAISLFKQNYSTNIFYASSFFGIATEYANYEFLMKNWKSIDGKDAFFDAEYEKMVSNEKDFIQNLWLYCGLEGSYSPEKRKKHVGITASMQQVTKEIYTTSIRKNDFAAQKEVFLDSLQDQRNYWASKTGN